MTNYRDSSTGTRASGTPKFYDDPLGGRVTLSGAWRLDSVASPPPPPPPPPSNSTPRMYLYPGPGRTDDGMKALLGQYPMGGSSYWQIGNAGNMVASETARVRKGMDTLIAIAPKDSTNFPTGALTYVKGLVDGTTTAVNFWTNWLTNCQTVALANPDQRVYIFPYVEPEVGMIHDPNTGASTTPDKGFWGSVYTAMGSNLAEAFRELGRFTSAWFALAAEVAPACRWGIWIGGSSGRTTDLTNMFSTITNPPRIVGTDPYRNSLNTATPQQTWQSRVDAFKASTGSFHQTWLAWGSPRIGLTETGIDQADYTDAQMATWISQFYESAVTLDLAFVTYFNSSGGNGNQYIIQSAFPKSVAALSGEVTQAKTAAAA